MPNVSKPGAKRTEWRVDGFVFETRAYADGVITLFVEIDRAEADEIITVGRALTDQKAGRVVNCSMPILERRDGRLCLCVWGQPPKDFGEVRAGSVVSVTVNLMPVLYKGGLWRLTAFPLAQRLTEHADLAVASKSEPGPETETAAPSPDQAPDSASTSAVLAIVPKSGLLRSSNPGSMPRPMPSLQPGRRRELYAVNRGVR